MKADLDLKLIKSLTLDQVPESYDAKGKLVFAANNKKHANGKPNANYVSSYILWDGNRAAPPGFGVRVAAKKTYVIRRKVHGKSIMPTVGNVADFNKLDDARAKAADMARAMVETGKNPNELARKASAAELTVGQAMALYREHLVARAQKPAKPLRPLTSSNAWKTLGWWRTSGDAPMAVCALSFRCRPLAVPVPSHPARTPGKWWIFPRLAACRKSRQTQHQQGFATRQSTHHQYWSVKIQISILTGRGRLTPSPPRAAPSAWHPSGKIPRRSRGLRR